MENQEQLINLSDIRERVPWPLRDIVFGICLIVAFLLLTHVDLFPNNHWIAYYLSVCLWGMLLISLTVYPLYIFKKRNFQPLDFAFPYSLNLFVKGLSKALFIAIIIQLVIGLISGLLEIAFQTEIKMPESWIWTTYAPNSIVVIAIAISGVTLGPFAEELFFRGFLYNAFKSRISVPIAAIMQAAIFAFYHEYDLLNSFLVFLVGIALVIVYEKRKNLLFPIAVHSILNAFWAIPLLLLTLQNFHVPAKNWDEAKLKPGWMKSYPQEEIEKQNDGYQQWEYAINTWGSKGSRQWKLEANAFNAVCFWFPEDRSSCAKAKLGIVSIYYYYLGDYRRAIIEADDIIFKYPDQKAQLASALVKRGYAFFMIKDFNESRSSFNRVLNEFKEHKRTYEHAQQGIELLDGLEEK